MNEAILTCALTGVLTDPARAPDGESRPTGRTLDAQ